MTLSIGRNSTVGRFLSSSNQSLKYCDPPSGSCVRSCSCSSRNSSICSVICQFKNSALRVAVSSFSWSVLPITFVLTGPSGGNSSLMALAAKSTHPSAIAGCTTLLAPIKVAPPGASLPRPVRLMPSSYCLSRSERASLSVSSKSKYRRDRSDSSPGSIMSARLS